MSATTNNKIEQACEEALQKFKQIDKGDFKEVISKLEYVLGSYRYDHNPVGLHEMGAMALDILKKYKNKNPRKVSKKLVADLEKAVGNT